MEMVTSPFSSRSSSSYSQVERDDSMPTDLKEDNKIEEHSGVATTFRIDDDDDDDLEEQRLNPLSDTPSTTSSSSTTASLATTASPRTIPSNYICPLTLQAMQEPVNDGCGHCFERQAIVDWLEYHEICPISRKPLEISHLHPANDLQRRIQQWRESHSTTENAILESSSSSDYSGEVMESLLLPQELQVLQIIKVRARDRQSKEDVHNCLWALVATVALCLCLASILAIKYFEMELRGPI